MSKMEVLVSVHFCSVNCLVLFMCSKNLKSEALELKQQLDDQSKMSTSCSMFEDLLQVSA